MSDHFDYDRNQERYQRMPRYELEAGDGSARRVWALVAVIGVGVLLIVLASGFGRTPVEHPGGATAPSVSAPADDAATGTGATGVQSVPATDGQ